MLCVIIPTYNAASGLERLLPQLTSQRIIVSDGGSSDGTLALAIKNRSAVALGAKGRGAQLRLGAHLASLSGETSDWFLFLHADSQLPEGWERTIQEAMSQDVPRYFRFKADAKGLSAWWMNQMVALRCWAFGLPYGDQGLLISRKLYEQTGGYADMALFEDVDLVERIKKMSKLRPLDASLTTDVSKHQRDGLWRRGLRNLGLLWRYSRGATVTDLLKAYQ